jgi:hypothetical protein
MAAAVNIEQTTAARGASVAVNGSGYPPGHTAIIYLNGNYMGVQPTTPTTTVTGGTFAGPLVVPQGTPVGAAKPAVCEDGTNIAISATDTLTVT